MPVILNGDSGEEWLMANTGEGETRSFLQSLTSPPMIAYPVTTDLFSKPSAIRKPVQTSLWSQWEKKTFEDSGASDLAPMPLSTFPALSFSASCPGQSEVVYLPEEAAGPKEDQGMVGKSIRYEHYPALAISFPELFFQPKA